MPAKDNAARPEVAKHRTEGAAQRSQGTSQTLGSGIPQEGIGPSFPKRSPVLGRLRKRGLTDERIYRRAEIQPPSPESEQISVTDGAATKNSAGRKGAAVGTEIRRNEPIESAGGPVRAIDRH